MTLGDTLLTSVPAAERANAERALPEATLLPDGLDADVADAYPQTRVLAVTIHDHPTPDALARFPNLSAVVTRSDGYDHLPLPWLKDQGVPAYHLGDYAGPAVARLTVAFILALLRRVPEGAAGTRAGSWARTHLTGRDLPDVTVGVLGTGKIGRRVARHVVALGGTVRGYDVDPSAYPVELEGFTRTSDLDELLALSDVLAVHVPLDATTRGLLDETHLRRLRPGALLVNTARGALVDQAAVARLLDDAHLAGYAADVLPGEPDPPDLDLLRGRDNVLLTPHLAAYDGGTIRERYARTGRIAAAVVSGREGDVGEWRVG